jgi:hypothetical protein
VFSFRLIILYCLVQDMDRIRIIVLYSSHLMLKWPVQS